MNLHHAANFCSLVPLFRFLLAKIFGTISQFSISKDDDDEETDAARVEYLAAQKHFKQTHLIRGLWLEFSCGWKAWLDHIHRCYVSLGSAWQIYGFHILVIFSLFVLSLKILFDCMLRSINIYIVVRRWCYYYCLRKTLHTNVWISHLRNERRYLFVSFDGRKQYEFLEDLTWVTGTWTAILFELCENSTYYAPWDPYLGKKSFVFIINLIFWTENSPLMNQSLVPTQWKH